jgi:predicted transcriptional regulator of viral defense system
MKFDELISIVGNLEWFDLATVVQLSDEPRRTITNQLYRWTQAGKIISLRRGMYALAERYRRVSVQPAALANALHRPSYLSCQWALGFYGLIPEGVPVFTSVTTRTPERFENAFGEFVYSNVKQTMFFGYAPVSISDHKVLLAIPEKALLDYWHLASGEWTNTRMQEMRFQQHQLIDEDKLRSLAAGIGKRRLLRAVEIWFVLARTEQEGMIEL